MSGDEKLKYLWPIIDLDKPFFGFINLCNVTMFRIAMFRLENCGIRSGFKGIYLSIEGIGGYHFLDKNIEFHPSYVSEKLNVPRGDATVLADFINDQLGIAHEQYGHYNDELLNNNEPYAIFGETNRRAPLIPAKVAEFENR